MSELTHHTSPAGQSGTTYFRTATGTRVHLPECPHLADKEAHVASVAERVHHPICDWSEAQLLGQGREYFQSIEDAMRRVGLPESARATVLWALRGVVHDEIYAVHSLSYAALGRHGRPVASFGKTYYWVGRQRVNLPHYRDVARNGHTAPAKHGEACPVPACGLVMSLSGECDLHGAPLG